MTFRRCREWPVEVGKPHPLGAHPDRHGVNFSVFAQHATQVELLLFDAHDDLEPRQVIELTPDRHMTFFFWHCYVRGAAPGVHYAYRVDGPDKPEEGHRYNRAKVLIDPYARGNTTTLWNRVAACGPEDNLAQSRRSVVIDAEDYDWEGDRPLDWPMQDSIIYELHVRGLTQDPSSQVTAPGTFRGVIEKIPYLQDLGVTAVELLPVHEFDDTEVLRLDAAGQPLYNYWGYSTLGFFAPAPRYCVNPEGGDHLNEFRDMVKALHRAGLEVILDVVYNHTNEGNHQGPTISFKGFDNCVYYHTVPEYREYYLDYTGCGNTFNCNHPMPEKLILDSLEFWANEMHVDGFRFDEGTILTRGEAGEPMPHPPVVWNLELSESLADTKLIAEAWDAAGLYQVGYFPGDRWAEWNGKFRDDVRRFVAGTPGLVGAVASRIAGSAVDYQASGRLPICSINFVCCHDGFTLNDLVSYNEKHNDANGEGNRDGVDDNLSWNCGAEGDTADPARLELRNRQVKNLAAILLLSQGVPMILGGDEIRRTQGGNNNAYCQDSPVSWYDWTRLEIHADVHRFFREMIALRKRFASLRRRHWFTGAANERGVADVVWHGCRIGCPGWDDPGSRVLAFTLGGFNGENDLHVILNMADEALEFELPTVDGRGWHLAVDTFQPSPADVFKAGQEPVVSGQSVRAGARSVMVLVSQ